MNELLTRHALAQRLHCHAQSLSKWAAEEGMPIATRGRGGRPSLYDESVVRAWLAERRASADASGPDLAHARARKELAQAIEAEQRVAMRAGKLLPIEDVDRVWSGHIAAVRTRLLAIPMALADRLHRVATLEGPAAVEAVLQEAVYAVLTELATGGTPPAKGREKRHVRKAVATRKRRS